MHTTPIPMLGGVALFVSIAMTLMFVMEWAWSPWLAGMVGAMFICLIGLYDDKYAMNPWVKMGLQSIVISWLFLNNIRISFITWPGDLSPLFFGPLTSFIVTQVWMITIINMFNIIDGIDGLAVGVSCLTSVVLLLVSITVSPPIVSYMLCSIIGATAMFLRFNFYPAKIFLGDSGALLLGYCFALASVLGVLKSTVSVIVLVFIFAVPLMDMVLSVIRRLLKRRNIFYLIWSISIINWWAEGYPSQSQPLFYMPLPSFLVLWPLLLQISHGCWIYSLVRCCSLDSLSFFRCSNYPKNKLKT